MTSEDEVLQRIDELKELLRDKPLWPANPDDATRPFSKAKMVFGCRWYIVPSSIAPGVQTRRANQMQMDFSASPVDVGIPTV